MVVEHKRVKVPDGRDNYRDWTILKDNAQLFLRMLRACENTRPRPRYTIHITGNPYRAIITVARKAEGQVSERCFTVDIRDGSAHFWFQPYLESLPRILR